MQYHGSAVAIKPKGVIPLDTKLCFFKNAGLPLRGRDWGFPPVATMSVSPSYFQRKIEETENQKKPLAV